MRQQVGDGADLQPARADEREVPWPWLRDRLVEDPRGVVEGFPGGHAVLGQGRFQEPPDAIVERRLLGPEAVEAAPRLLDQPRRVPKDLLPRRVQAEWPFGLGRHA